jgi:hypothetical protein
MSREVPKEQTGSFLMIATIAGLFVGGSLFFTLINLGVPHLETTVFSLLGGFTLGAFVYRERMLTRSDDLIREQHSFDVSRLEKRIEHYYDHSLACLAHFDAGTLLVDKASPGFLQLLSVPPDFTVRGKSIVELLHVSHSQMETIVNESRLEGGVVKGHSIMVEDSRGNRFPLEVTLNYSRETHMVEAAFWVAPVNEKGSAEEGDIAQKDLERFRRGMYRRETRILELKEEVNEILKASGQEPRYRFAQKAQDTQVPLSRMSNIEKTSR